VDSFADNVFLGLGNAADADDGSVSSSSDDDSHVDEKEKKEKEAADNADSRPSANKSVAASAAANADAANEDPEVICIDDDTAGGIFTQIGALSSPSPDASTTRRRNKRKRADDTDADADTSEVIDKWKTKAKRYKRRARALEAQSTERNEHHMRLTSRLRDVEEREEELKKERDAIRTSIATNEEDMQSLELDLTRAKRQLKELEDNYSSVRMENAQLKNEKTLAESTMKQIRERHRKELDQSNAEGMAEVQELLNERPKLVEEIRRLKELLNKARSASASTSTGIKGMQRNGTKLNAAANAARIAKDMRIARDQKDEEDKREARRKKDLEMKAKMVRKVSAQAARMSRAAKAKVAPLQSSANTALGGAISSSLVSKSSSRSAAQSGTFLQRSSSLPSASASRITSRRREYAVSPPGSSRTSEACPGGGIGSRGLVLLGDTNSLRRSNSAASSRSAPEHSLPAAVRIPFPSSRKKSSDIRSMFTSRK